MPLGFANISSLGLQRELQQTTGKLAGALERLSSGLRINHAGDDAAAFQMAGDLDSDKRICQQALRNVNDGISLVSVADAALQEMESILTRQKELASQAANGMYTVSQRQALIKESDSLTNEYNRIIASTDFNGFNLLDRSVTETQLQAGEGDGNTISFSLGGNLESTIGTGTFAAALTYATWESYRSRAIATADLDGDGILDVVTAGATDISTGSATVMIGNGDGTFRVPLSYAAEALSTTGLALDDVNGDGKVDLVTGGTYGGYARTTVRLGNGNGTFQASTSFVFCAGDTYALTMADLDGDERLDIISAGDTGAGGFAAILIGNGDGTFRAARTYATETTKSMGVTVADINNDGEYDLLTAGLSAGSVDGYVTVRMGNGDGTFGSARAYTDGSSTYSLYMVHAADLNRDGIMDMVAEGYTDSNDGYAAVRLGLGDGTFGSATSYATESYYSNAGTVADMNGDGLHDLVTAGASDGPGGGYVTIRLGRGDGTFGTATSYRVLDYSSRGMTVADVNNDDVLDVLTAGFSPATDGYMSISLARTHQVTTAPFFDITSQAAAAASLTTIDSYLDKVSAERSAMGAVQSRLSFTVNILSVARENFAAAFGTIMDLDVAEETSRLVRAQILQQAAAAMLAQANQESATVLKLLGA